MTNVDSTSTLGTEPITFPAELKISTPEQQQLYRASLEFERVFVQQLLKPLDSAGSMLGDADDATGSTSGYQDLVKDTMTKAVLDGGGLGVAASIYQQMAKAAGVDSTSAPAKEQA